MGFFGARLKVFGGIRRRRLAALSLAAAVFVTAAAPVGPGFCGAALAAESQGYSHPVKGQVVRRYEAPSGPYAKGHRGIDYGVVSGTAVKSSNAGKVSFAGPVADDGLFVTLKHSDGLATTYSFLSRVDVKAGDEVAKGKQVGLSGGGHPDESRPVLHFGMKRDGEYTDPEPLLQKDYDDISDALSLAPTDQGGGSGRRGSYDSSSGSGYSFGAGESPTAAYPASPKSFQANGPQAKGVNARSPGGRRPNANGADGKSSRANSSDANGADGRRPNAGGPDGKASGHTGGTSADGFHGSSDGAGGYDAFSPGGRSPKGSDFASRAQSIGRFLAGNQDVPAFVPGRYTPDQLRPAQPNAKGPSAKGFKSWLGKQADKLGAGLDGVPSIAFPGFNVAKHLASGFLHQIGCNARGGAEPPKMPTTEQLERNEAKPPPAPNDNIVVLVGGLNTHSERKNGKFVGHSSLFDMDPRTMGYKEDQIYHYSYKGIKKHAGSGPDSIHVPYTWKDTHKSIRRSAILLSRQVDALHAQNPGKKIDILAHSEGGVVAAEYIENFYKKRGRNPIQLDHFIPVDSPLQGADLARMGTLFTDSAAGRAMRPFAEWPLVNFMHAPRADSPLVKELVEDSTFIKDLQKHWDNEKVKTTTIASPWDPVVTAPHTRLPGDDHYTVMSPWVPNLVGSHGGAPGAAKGIIYNALADKKSQCTAFKNAFADHVSGPALAAAEDGAILGTQAFLKNMTPATK